VNNGITDAIDASAANINNAINIGANAIAGTNFNVSGAGAIVGVSLDTGNGANELFAMDQNVLQASSPTFAGLTLNGNLDMTSDLILNIGDTGTDFLAGGGLNVAGLLTANANLNIANGATSSGVLKILEDSDAGTEFATFQVPALAANTVYTLPPDDGDAGEQLQTNGSGVLTWESSGGVPTTITVADTADSSTFVALFNDATGDLAPKTDAGLTYDATTAALTATTFIGALTGNVTGNVSGSAATVTAAAQPAITSVGTLTGLAMGGDINLANNLVLNIGAAGTDFTAGGGLTLAELLTVNDDVDLVFGAGENLNIDASSTANTTTGGVIDL